MDEHAFGINVADLQVPGFFETEAQGIDGPEIDSDAFDAAGIDDRVYLIDRKDFRERLGVLEFHGCQRFPGSLASSGVEELDAGVGDTHGPVGELLDVLEVQEVAP